MPLNEADDAYGFGVWEHLHGTTMEEIVARSDGFIANSGGRRRL
jgi:hypothetical protein